MVGKSVVTLDGLSTNQILDLLHKAEYIDSHRKEIAHTCDGRVLATLFYEPSTRTRLSLRPQCYVSAARSSDSPARSWPP